MGVIKKQGIWNTVISYLGILIGFINIIFVQPNLLKPEELGLIRVLFSFSSVVALFLPLGIGNITVRFFNDFKDEKSGNHGFFALILIFPLIGFLVFGSALYYLKPYIISHYVDQSKLFTDYFMYVFPLLFVLSYVSVLGIYSSVLFKTIFISVMNDIVVRVLSIVLVACYFNKLFDLNSFIVLFVGIYLIQAIAILISIFIHSKPNIHIHFEYFKNINLKEIFKFGFILWFIALAGFALKSLDMILIGKYLPLSLVGIYSVCAFIPLVIESPLIALDRISAPKIGEAWSKNDVNEVSIIYSKSSYYLMLIAGIMSICILCNVNDLILLLPEKYHIGKNVIYIICFGTFFNMSTGLNDPVIFYSKKYLFALYLLIFMILFSFIANDYFIPKYGIIGAALVAMFSNMMYNVIKFIFIYLRFKINPYTKQHFQLLLMFLITLIITFIIPFNFNYLINIFFRSFLAMLIYFSLLYKYNLANEIFDLIPRFKK